MKYLGLKCHGITNTPKGFRKKHVKKATLANCYGLVNAGKGNISIHRTTHVPSLQT